MAVGAITGNSGEVLFSCQQMQQAGRLAITTPSLNNPTQSVRRHSSGYRDCTTGLSVNRRTSGIRSEQLQSDRLLFQFGQRFFRPQVCGMTFKVEKEDVPCLWTPDRKRFDPCQIDIILLESRQCLCQCAWLVGNLQQQRRLVMTGRLGRLISNHSKAGQVAGIVFDVFRHHLQVVLHSGLTTRNGCGSRFITSQLGSCRCTGHLNQPGLRHVAPQPFTALRQCLGLAVNLGNLGNRVNISSVSTIRPSVLFSIGAIP